MMQRILVHDLATDTYEYVNFLPARTLCTSYTKPDINNGGHLPGFVDHTRPTQDYVSSMLQRQALSQPIHSVDASDDIKPSFVSPCQDVLNLTRPHRAFGPVMSRAYINMAKKVGQLDAMRALEEANERLTKMEFRYTSTDEELCDFAKAKSAYVMRQVAGIKDVTKAFKRACDILADYGLSFRPELIKKAEENGELKSLINRATNELWWRRSLRKHAAIEIERAARDLTLVHKYGQAYCSDFSLGRRRQRDADNADVLRNTIAYDEDDSDNWFSLYELSGKSISNPEIRRAEMFVRLKGFENIAKASGHVAMFYTPTCPSRFHSVSKGKVNQAWLDAGRPTTQDAHNYMTDMFESFRKALDKAEIKVYGLRVVEPHADGCPHWHVLFFMEQQHCDTVTRLFRHAAMADSPDEPGASKYRFKAEPIDWSKGSAVGYVAKYLSKNIDGQHIGDDIATELDGITAAERVVTWARVNGIRQFQFIGGPSVTVWRELRRIREEFTEDDTVFKHLDNGEWMTLENIRRAADSSDWEAFCLAMGGVFVRRDDQTIKPCYHVPHIMEKLIDEYGEEHQSTKPRTTRYGDVAGARVVGVVFKAAYLATRTRTWKTENKEVFLRGTKRIMTGVTDVFDALEREGEYLRMADEQYEEYQRYLDRLDEMNAYVFDEADCETVWSGRAKAEREATDGSASSPWTCVNNCH
ncbi:replication endonuclease [Photobacterium sp. J15]|uniref:replication endonuclease n=1 Tax=Photobacterium sp. J15 TaxID=265901 RepID=UPI000A007D7F|nr:replication endonuclease [Photobacterium sp. J15]